MHILAEGTAPICQPFPLFVMQLLDVRGEGEAQLCVASCPHPFCVPRHGGSEAIPHSSRGRTETSKADTDELLGADLNQSLNWFRTPLPTAPSPRFTWALTSLRII